VDGGFIAPGDQARLSSHRSTFTAWRRPIGQEKRSSGNYWTNSRSDLANPSSQITELPRCLGVSLHGAKRRMCKKERAWGGRRIWRSLYVVSAAEWRPPASHWLWSEPAYFVHLNLLSYLKPYFSFGFKIGTLARLDSVFRQPRTLVNLVIIPCGQLRYADRLRRPRWRNGQP
jgi:hypothetical protein